MGAHLPRTEFLDAAIADDETLRRQRAAILRDRNLTTVLEAVGELVVFLNKERQIVYANKAAADYIGAHGGSVETGRRWGEALHCVHASSSCCGTTEYCKTCAAATAIWSSQHGHDSCGDCRITQDNGDAMEFRVKTASLRIGEDEFTVLTAVDVGDEKRREALQKTFFHDVLNTAFGIRGIVELLPEETPENKETFIGLLDGLSDELIEEITALRDLLAAESHNLTIRTAQFDPLALLREVIAGYRQQVFTKGKTILFEPPSSIAPLTSDRTLLRRVLANMLKNALEAAAAGETVGVGLEQKDGQVEFWMSNPEAMPVEVRHQIFQRSYSTKGAGRGLGTYSMKLLTERYLGGKIEFTSRRGEGTRFTARYPLTLPPKA